jgi:c-di-AMP phosphodiesterase-like protein
MYVISLRAGIMMSVFTCICLLALIALVGFMRKDIFASMVEFATNYTQVQKQLLNEMSVPYGIIDEDGNILWLNALLKELLGRDKYHKKSITAIFESIKKENLPEEDEIKEVHMNFNERDYRVELKRIIVDELAQNVSIVDAKGSNAIIAMYMFDETEFNQNLKYIADNRMVSALIYIDNYEEALDSIEEVRRAVLGGLVDRKINKYVNSRGGIVKKLEKDKYIAVFTYKALEQMKSDKFGLLEEVKGISIGNEMAITVSVGIGTGAEDYCKNFDTSRAAMDLALGRGGDQVVVKDGEKIIYFGGKSQQIEKNTRVKARVKAHALREILMNKEKVFIMGHKLGDVDSLGAAVGVCRAAKYLNKSAYIVLNDITTSVKPLVDKLMANPDYEKDVFITGMEAEEMIDQSSVVVVVDVNKPSYTECAALLSASRTTVVIDHHRQGNETVEGATLSYVEPNASSASEMVAELLQYIDNGVKLKTVEADVMYAGIIIDTNNFTNKAGVRTFEAAAFLRRNGADVIRVRKILRNDMDEYKARAEAIRNLEVYRGCYALAISPSAGLESPTIVAAQAANEILDIIGIKASFVVTEYNEQVYISARSIDEVNVQIIMEKLGGGGHMSIAGAQLKDCTAAEAVSTIKNTLDRMLEEGEI